MNEKDIRFIDSNYNELFRIKDGESITVTFPDGHTENRACRYIDDYHTYIGGNCFHICEWAERMEESKKTYAPAGKELFTLKNTTKDEFEFMFAPKDKETSRGCIGYLRADFGSGDSFYSTWFDETKELKTTEFKSEFDDVVNYFRETSRTPLLKSRDDMRSVCSCLKPLSFDGNKYTRAFKVTTEKHTYYFKCFPEQGDYNLYAYCYNTAELTKYRDLQFIEKNYSDLNKDKFFLTASGAMEMYYNPDANAGGQIVELTMYNNDIKEAAKYKNPQEFFSYLESAAKGALYDVGTDTFRETAEYFINAKASFEGDNDKTMKGLLKHAGVKEKSHKDIDMER